MVGWGMCASLLEAQNAELLVWQSTDDDLSVLVAAIGVAENSNVSAAEKT